jgi:tetratricopeptide (TPR) repeat protein
MKLTAFILTLFLFLFACNSGVVKEKTTQEGETRTKSHDTMNTPGVARPDTASAISRDVIRPGADGMEHLERQAPQGAFNPYEDLIKRALDFYRDSEYSAALKELNMAIQDDPEHPRAYYYRGQIYVDLNNFKEAKKDFLKVTSVIEDDHRAWNFLGATQTHEGDNESAVESYNKAIVLDPENALYYFNRGSSLGQLGKLQEAVTDFDQAVELGLNTSGIFNNRANARYMLGDFQGAIADFTRSMELDPESMAPYANRGIAYLYMRDTLRACADWQRALQMGHPLVGEYLERYCN